MTPTSPLSPIKSKKGVVQNLDLMACLESNPEKPRSPRKIVHFNLKQRLPSTFKRNSLPKNTYNYPPDLDTARKYINLSANDNINVID